MENPKWTDKQNEVFGKLFGELKKRNPSFRTEALTLLGYNDDNFIKLYTDIDNEIYGDEEDISLVHQRANHLKLK